jgi:hypothetical protein
LVQRHDVLFLVRDTAREREAAAKMRLGVIRVIL